MYSAYELNKQGDDIKPCCTPLQILRQSVIPCHFNCCYLTCIQVSQETGKMVWYSHLIKSFPQFVVIHTVKGCSVVYEADVFLVFPCFIYDPMDVGNLISGSSAFSKSSFLYIWKFSVHVLMKPSWEDFEHDIASMWNECNCLISNSWWIHCQNNKQMDVQGIKRKGS